MNSNTFLYDGKSKVPSNVTHVKCHSSLLEIPGNAFHDCEDLVSVELNEGLIKIDIGAFRRCESLTNINFPSTLQVIGDYAFLECEILETADFNEGLKIVGIMAFYNCFSLTNINFPSTLQIIGECAFQECNPDLLDLPNGLKEIGRGAFMSSAYIKRISIPSSVKVIEPYTFFLCPDLISVELSEGLEEIGDGAFSECQYLRNLFIPSSVIKLGSIFKNPRGKSRPPKLLARQFPNDDKECTLLINALKTKFVGLPIHQLCYFQGHYPALRIVEKLYEAIESQKTSEETCDIFGQTDVFGMTPFHILALSVKSNIALLQKLIEICPSSSLSSRDESGSCATEYLIDKIDGLPESDTMINQLLQPVLVDRMQWLGLDKWENAVRKETANFPEAWNGVVERKRQLKKIYSTLERYERFEVLSLLEEFIWSMKINELPAKESRCPVAKSCCIDSDRQTCRINCGADVIIPNVLPFLGSENWESEGEDESVCCYYYNDDDDSESEGAENCPILFG